MAGSVLHTPTRTLGMRFKRALPYILMSLLGITVLLLFLAPLGYMALTSLKTINQIRDPYSQFLPSSPVNYSYEGKEYPLLQVPTEDGVRELALVKPGREQSEYVDPQNPEAGLFTVEGRWRTFDPVYSVDITTENFPTSWNQINLGRLFRNTIFIAIIGTVGTLLSSVVVAYGFARFRVPGIGILFIILISTIILPRQVTLIPTYIFFRAIGWGGTWLPLIVPHFFANAYNVFLLRQYFRAIPRDLDEAATLDGATPWQVLWHVILPQSYPALVAVGLFHFFYAWNDFFEPLVYLQGREDLYTISIGMTQFNNIFTTQPGLAMAASMMAIALPLFMFVLAQRVFIQGIVITGVEK
ncbi:MAG TPA: carbohydrate ABC transporter permease [Anaerolineales bacterium]|nr:carbohydrate ABC transporter permease [Anaerolineales bacterium]HRQ91677.1 carbohydrate ABC transporter permease [Anaerolineales bacterium]